MPPVIRPAKRADLDPIVLLWREMWDQHVAVDPRVTPTANANRVMRDLLDGWYEGDDAGLFVAEEGGRLVGYVLALILENPAVVPNPRFGYVSDLAVTAACRRLGTGSQLLDEAHAWFRKRGVKTAEVQVSALNPRAAAFWKRHGYAPFVERLQKGL
jgi:ribosomal protein S18 acetylase RimI-like enzyme